MINHRIRQPRVAGIVAARLRDDILSGRLKEGDAERTAHMIGMVPQSRGSTSADVSGALVSRRGNTLAFGMDKTIEAKLISGSDHLHLTDKESHR